MAQVIKQERGFEQITANIGYIPVRSTEFSAGYDFQAIESKVIDPGEKTLFNTGIKAFMQPDEYLKLEIRSNLGAEKDLMMANTTGVIDADYYNNPKNEGHIMIYLRNLGKEPVFIEAGDKIVQGIFHKYLTTGDVPTKKRVGGIGSTGK